MSSGGKANWSDNAMIDLGRHNLLGIGIDAVDYEAAVERIIDAARRRIPLGVSALAVHGVMTGVLDREHRHRLNHLDLVVPDGQPVRWGLNWLHRTQLAERVYGPELTLRTCAAAAGEDIPVFLFGTTDPILTELRTRLADRFPRLRIAGSRASRFRRITSEEKTLLVKEIHNSGAAITLVGLGCPRQEVWAYEFKEALRMPVLAVGAAFAFHAGRLAQAPRWMQRAGLEWLYRLTREPGRLWKRYLFLNPYFLSLLVLQKTGLKHFETGDTIAPEDEVLYG